MDSNSQIFTEIFPINTSEIPTLSAYRLDIRGSDASTIGGKLSYRLKKTFNGHWVWTCYRIVTDTPVNIEDVYKVVEQLWKEQPDTFKGLRSIEKDPSWTMTPQAASDFVARGLLPDVDREIRTLLAKESRDIGIIRVEREYDVKGWVVDGRPSISISINSSLIHKQELRAYAKQLPDINDIVGLQVAAKTSSLKGEIVEIAGKLGESRQRLLSLSSDERMREILRNGPDDEPVVEVLAGLKQYEYPLSGLRIIVRVGDFARFKVNGQQALSNMRIAPALRNQLVSLISNTIKGKKLIGTSYNSKEHAGLFPSLTSIGFNPRIKLGKNSECEYSEKSILGNLQRNGPYRRASEFVNAPIRIGIINSTAKSTDAFKSSMQYELKKLGYNSTFVMEEKSQGNSPSELRVQFEECLKKYDEAKPHVLLIILPNEYGDEETSTYQIYKSITIGRDIASQAVKESTMDNRYAIANIILGILGKTGNIPYILANPLPYADIIVGIDIARERKRRLAGSINATAISRIYFSNGEFLRYIIHDAPLEGETIPDQVLQSLFPLKEFQGKRVIVHRDGIFRGNEKQALKEWAKKIGAQFYLVEIIKTGSPRIYAANNGSVIMPPKGSAFKINDHEALLVSSPPPFNNATPQPLRIRTEAPLTIEQALNSAIMLTLLHYGSLRSPRLPVTIHYSDKIAYLALRGIKPKNLEGTNPFWL